MRAIYIFPGLSSNPEELAVFIGACQANFRVVVVDYPQWRTRRPGRPDLAGLIGHCRHQIEPAAEIVLVGYSFGGHLAFAVAAELAHAADVTVCMLDTSAEPYLGPSQRPEIDGLLQRMVYACGNLLWRAQFRLARAVVEGPDAVFRLTARFGGFGRRTVKAIQMNLNLPILREILGWMAGLPEPVRVRILLFRCATQRWDTRDDLGWLAYAATVGVIDIPGDHDTVVNPANATVFAGKFQQALVDRPATGQLRLIAKPA